MTSEYYVPGEAPAVEPAVEPQSPAAAPSYEPQPTAEPAARVLVEPEADTESEGAFAGPADPAPKTGGKAKVVLVALGLVAAIGVGVGAGAYLASGQDAAGEPEPAAITASGPVFTVEVSADGYDPATSTPFIVTATGTSASGAIVSVSHAVGAGASTWELGEGSYSFTAIPAVNADGSTYSLPSSIDAQGGVIAIAASRIPAADVGTSYAAKVVSAIEAAISRSDGTLPASVLETARSYLPAAAAAAASAEEAADSKECEHDWELDTVDGDPIYVDGKPVYGNGAPIYESHVICSCGIDCTAAGVSFAYHKSTHGSDYYYPNEVSVITGYEQIITGYEQKLVGYEQVPVGYACSKCGEERELEE